MTITNPAPEPAEQSVPGFYLLKVEAGERVHYVFCEMVVSCNFPAEGCAPLAGEQAPFLPQDVLENLLATQKRRSVALGASVADATVLTGIGDANSPLTAAMIRSQSTPSTQSFPRPTGPTPTPTPSGGGGPTS